jgi:hypothetical protein
MRLLVNSSQLLEHDRQFFPLDTRMRMLKTYNTDCLGGQAQCMSETALARTISIMISKTELFV